MDQGFLVFEWVVYFTSQIADIDLHSIWQDIRVIVPDVGDDMIFGQNFSCVFHEVFQK